MNLNFNIIMNYQHHIFMIDHIDYYDNLHLINVSINYNQFNYYYMSYLTNESIMNCHNFLMNYLMCFITENYHY